MDQQPGDEQQTLHAGRAVPILMIVIFSPPLAVGLLLLLTLSVELVLLGLLIAAFCSLFIVLGIIMLIPEATFLRLSPEHFTVCHGFRRWSVPWTMIDRFFVINLNVLANPLNPIKNKRVGYNLIRSPGLAGEFSRGLVGAEGMLPDNYGKKAEALAELMNTWLLRARSRAEHSSPESAVEYDGEPVVRNQSVRGAGRASVRQIDVSLHSAALRLLRSADYALVLICGMWGIGILTDILNLGIAGLFLGGFFFFCVYVGWRHRGAIDPSFWKVQLVIFPGLFLFALLVLAGAAIDANNWRDSTLIGVVNALWVAGSTLGSMVAIVLLSIVRITDLHMRVPKLVKNLRKAGHSKKAPKAVSRANRRSAIVLGLVGVAVLIGVLSIPLPHDLESGRYLLKLYQFVGLFGFLLLILAQRFLQTPAADLLSADKRPMILFLRSFADDDTPKFKLLDNSFVDFSLETRLAKYFRRFGPFVAVASPRDTLPQLGAARATSADREWHSNVLAWISQASVIVLYAGKTRWVNWELARIIDANSIGKLILLMPELKGSRRKRFEETTERFNRVKQVFHNTLWSWSLDLLTDLMSVRAITFSADGSITAVTSNTRNRDSYHLAAVVAHYLNLTASPAPTDLANSIARTAAIA